MPIEGKGVYEGRTLADIVDEEPVKDIPADDDADVEEPDDVDVEDADVTPDSFEGKTADELKQILKKRTADVKKRDSVVGRQGNELDQLRREISDLRERQAFTEGATQVPRVPADEPFVDPLADTDDDDYITAREAKTLLSKVLEQDRKALIASGRDRLIETAGTAHLEGKASLANIPVAKGIEAETEAVVVAAFKPRIMAGYDVSQYIRDPKTWKKAAEYVRFQRGEFNMLTQEALDSQSQTEPVPPFSGETPTGRKAFTGKPSAKELDARSKYIVSEFDLNEDEVAAATGGK